MTDIEDLLQPEAVAALLALASAAADGEAIGLMDDEGRLVAGRSPGPVPARVHAVAHGGLGAVVGTDGVRPELLALVARSLELMVLGAEEHALRARADQELAIGHRIQLALVPRRFPVADGWAFAAAYEPAREVGGDMFDAFNVRDRPGEIGLLVADVTGKGLPAALMMADVRAILHAAADNTDSAAYALARVNRILALERPTSLFVTAALVMLDTVTGVARYASAGHEAPLLVRASGEVVELESDGPLLGAFGDAAYEECSAELAPGDALVIYTDGITDARDAGRGFFGQERLLAAIDAAGGGSADAIVRSIVDDVRAFRGAAEPYDDLTLLVATRRS